MAKVVLTFTDIDGRVNVKSEPTFAEMMKKLEGNLDVSDAEAYALYALRMVREKSKEKKGLIQLPKTKRLM